MKNLTSPVPQEKDGILFITHRTPTGNYGRKVAELLGLLGATAVVGNDDAYKSLIDSGVRSNQIKRFGHFEDNDWASLGFTSAVMPMPRKLMVSLRTPRDSQGDVAILKSLKVPFISLVVMDVTSAQETAANLANIDDDDAAVTVANAVPAKVEYFAKTAARAGKIVISSEEDLDQLIAETKRNILIDEGRKEELIAMHGVFAANTWKKMLGIGVNIDSAYSVVKEGAEEVLKA